MKPTQVKLFPFYNEKLNELSEKRKDERNPVKTKQAIVEQLIEAAHKKECK